MLGFLCSLWPWLLGGLIGWLLCGLLARRMFRGPDLRPQLAEKDVHIRRLTGDMAALQARPPVQVEKVVEKVVEKIVEKPVDRVIEKFVDRPVDRVVEKLVDRPVDRVVEKVVEKYVDRPVERIVEKIVDRPVDRVVEKIIDRPVERLVEKVVEKQVDSPALLARVAALTAEVAVIAGLRSRLQVFESTPPQVVEKIVEKPVDRIVEKIVEKVVEKVVEKPVDRIVEKIVEKPVEKIVEKIVEKKVDSPAQAARIAALTSEVAVIPGLRGRIKQLESATPKVVEKIVEKPVDRIVEKIVEKPVDRIVEKTVEKLVDNPANLARIAALTAEVAVIAGLRSRVQQLEAAPPKVIEKLVDRPVDRIVEKVVEKIIDRPVDRVVEKPVDRIVEKVVEKIVDRPVDRVVERVVEKQVPDTRGLEERDRQLADWQRRHAELEAQLRRVAEGPALDLAAAKAAGFSVKGADDLEIIEGIGPKIADLLRNAGIRTFAQLANTPEARIQSVLDAGGSAFRIANPGTWAEQADLAARNRWTALKDLQGVLDAGVRVVGAAKAAPAAAGAADAAALQLQQAEISALKQQAAEVAVLKQQLAERDAEIQRLREGPPPDLAAAKAAGFLLKGRPGWDDLEIIEGIGPKIAGLLNAAGVTRFYQLAAMAPAQIQPILDAAGPSFKLARPDTWPEQAGMAARNQWGALKALQDALNAGNRA